MNRTLSMVSVLLVLFITACSEKKARVWHIIEDHGDKPTTVLELAEINGQVVRGLFFIPSMEQFENSNDSSAAFPVQVTAQSSATIHLLVEDLNKHELQLSPLNPRGWDSDSFAALLRHENDVETTVVLLRVGSSAEKSAAFERTLLGSYVISTRPYRSLILDTGRCFVLSDSDQGTSGIQSGTWKVTGKDLVLVYDDGSPTMTVEMRSGGAGQDLLWPTEGRVHPVRKSTD